MRIGTKLLRFFDASSFAREFPHVGDLVAADFTVLDHFDLGDRGGVDRESTFDTDTSGDLADGEALANTFALDLDNYALEDLNTLLVTLLDLVGDGNRVARLERRQLDATLEGVLSNLD